MFKHYGESNNGVSPVIAIILLVAITVVLTGIVYMWIQGFSGTSDENMVYVGIEVNNYPNNDWKIEIQKVEGGKIQLESLSLNINNKDGIALYKKTIEDVNPSAFTIQASNIYPIPVNNSPVTSSVTSQPVNESDNLSDYIDAIFVLIDNDMNGRLSYGDVIRIIYDFEKDGTQDILHGYVFKLVNRNDSTLYAQYFI